MTQIVEETRDFDLYSWNTPNGQKVMIALEEVDAQYRYHPVDISNAEQHNPAFRTLSPDGKIPVLVTNGHPAVTHFESGAILLYLASLYPALHGNTAVEKARVNSWTFWQVGQLGPLAGQFGRFSTAAARDTDAGNPHAIIHFEKLVWRCLEVLEKRLAQSRYLAGDCFTVADIASLTWVASPKSYLQIYDVAWQSTFPSLLRWSCELMKRPSVIKAFEL